MIVGKIKPDELRCEILFAKDMIDSLIDSDKHRQSYGKNVLLKTWGDLLNILVKRIVPGEK